MKTQFASATANQFHLHKQALFCLQHQAILAQRNRETTPYQKQLPAKWWT